MSGLELYAIYWAPNGHSMPNQSLINQYLSDIGGPYFQMLGNEYGVGRNVKFGGSWNDPATFPTSATTQNPLEDSSIQSAVSDAVVNNPQWDPPSMSTLYLVFLGSSTELCDSGTCTFSSNNNGLCAYHGAFVDPSTSDQYIYAALPDDGDRLGACGINSTTRGNNISSPGPNGDTVADSEISTASHEIFEAATDPLPNDSAWRVNDSHHSYPEIGDLCNWFYATPGGDHANVSLGGDHYFIQDEYSNAAGSCVLLSGAIQLTVRYPGCVANSLPANDDGSLGPVAVPFAMDFFGTSYSSLYVNNNGNITFDAPQSIYTPYGLTSTNTPIIAPFFGDVDTRGTGSNTVTYGGSAPQGGNPGYFCVNWTNVGYYDGQIDKLNSFQLLMIDRSNTTGVSGDFDIEFNYEKTQWETGDASGGFDGLGGSSAVVGYSNGTTQSLQLDGSAINGSLIDGGSSSLVMGSQNSDQPGRYIFAVRNGGTTTGGTIQGSVTDTAQNPVAGAVISVCGINLIFETCRIGTTGSAGQYAVLGLPGGLYGVSVSPPQGSTLFEANQGPYLVTTGSVTESDFRLTSPAPLPVNTSLSGVTTNSNGTPVANWGESSQLSTIGCARGTATFRITALNSNSNQPDAVAGTLSESPAGSGHYVGSIPSLYPLHGSADFSIFIACPTVSQDTTQSFGIYIDPSGTVVDTAGNPVVGASVTLLSSDSLTDPFTAVASGSPVMSPGNRNNPVATSSSGSFGWDVDPGYYEVSATAPGCHNPTNATQSSVVTSAFSVPPAFTNIQLVLACDSDAITSPSAATATVAQPFTFLITTRGLPAPKLRSRGRLPNGVHFTDEHNGTATISGTPTSTKSRPAVGDFVTTITASFGKGKKKVVVSQIVTLQVH